MNLSPTDRKAVLEMAAASLCREIVLGGGKTMAELIMLPISVAEKMLGLDARTIKKRMEWVELTPSKSAVKLSTVQAYLAAATRQPSKERSAS